MDYGYALIPITAGGVVALNIINRIVWDWLKNKSNSKDPNGYMRVNEHERLCTSRLKGIEDKLDDIKNAITNNK